VTGWPFAIVFVVSFTYTVVSILRRLNERLDKRADARRRNQAHPSWRDR
jgi:hypothetical protein